MGGDSRYGQCCAFTDFVERLKHLDLAVLTKQVYHSLPVIQVKVSTAILMPRLTA